MATVFVPVILKVTRYVPEERLLLDMVATPFTLVQALVAVKLKLLTLGFELVTETEAAFPVKLVTVQLLLVTTPEMVNVVVAMALRLFVLNDPAPLMKATDAEPLDEALDPEKV